MRFIPLVATLACALSANAQIVPVGADIFPPGQTGVVDPPAVATLADGRFAVAWSAADGAVSAQADVFFAVFAADGTLTLGPLQANDHTAGGQTQADIGIDDSGRLVVAWASDSPSGPCKACVRRFDATGVPSGIESEVSGALVVGRIELASAPDGEHVVAVGEGEYCQPPFGPCFTRDVRAQRFAADGSTIDGLIDVATTGFYNDLNDLRVLADNSFVVAWENGDWTRLQRYGADNLPSENQRRTPLTLDVRVAARETGGYVISAGGNATGSPYLQLMDENGRLGPITGVSTICTDENPGTFDTDIALSDDGSFVLAWGSEREYFDDACADGDDSAIWARGFAPDGSPLDIEFLVNTHTPDRQQEPRIAAVGDGRYVLAWISAGSPGEPESGLRVALRRLEAVCNDADADGYGFPASPACTFGETDCDDTDPAVNPGMAEIPNNGIDDDCNDSSPGGCQPQL